MPATARGITYPASTDHTRIWEHLSNLASTANTAIDNIYPEFDYLNAYVASTQTINIAVTGIPFTQQVTVGGNIALASSTFGFIAPKSGLYVVAFQWRNNSRSSTADATFQWRYNAAGSGTGGTQVTAFYPTVGASTAGNFSHHSISIDYLNAGDTYELFANAGAPIASAMIGSSSATRLWVVRLPGIPVLG